VKKLAALLAFLAMTAHVSGAQSYPGSAPSYLTEVATDPNETTYTATDVEISVPASPNASSEYEVRLDYFPESITTVCTAVSGGGTCFTADTTGTPGDNEYYLDANWSRLLFNAADANTTLYVTLDYYSTVNRVSHTNDHRADTQAFFQELLVDGLSIPIPSAMDLSGGDKYVIDLTGISGGDQGDTLFGVAGGARIDGTGAIYASGYYGLGASGSLLGTSTVPLKEAYIGTDVDFRTKIDQFGGISIRTDSTRDGFSYTTTGNFETVLIDDAGIMTLKPEASGGTALRVYQWGTSNERVKFLDTGESIFGNTSGNYMKVFPPTDATAWATYTAADATQAQQLWSGEFVSPAEHAVMVMEWIGAGSDATNLYWFENGANDLVRGWAPGVPFRRYGGRLKITKITMNLYTDDGGGHDDFLDIVYISESDGDGTKTDTIVDSGNYGEGTSGWEAIEIDITDYIPSRSWVLLLKFDNDSAQAQDVRWQDVFIYGTYEELP
jgi:hypothetical protein